MFIAFQISLVMLKRCIEPLKSESSSQASIEIQLQELENHINEALWRLELLQNEPDDRCNIYFSPDDNRKNLRKSWLARLNPSVHCWYTNSSPNRRRLRTKSQKNPNNNKKPAETRNNALLINEMLSQPISLMVRSMVNLQWSTAGQVADKHQLWDTAEGKELEYSLQHISAVQELQRAICTRQILPPSSSDDPIDHVVTDGLNRLAVPSAVETILSTLLQTAAYQPDVDEEGQTAVLLADLILSSSSLLNREDAVDILTFALSRITVDWHVEPWKTVRRFVECVQQLTEADPTASVSPQRTPLALDAEHLRKGIDGRRRFEKELQHFLAALDDDSSKLDVVFLQLDDALRCVDPGQQQSSYLVRLGHYIQLLRQLIPPRFQNESPLLLLERNAGEMILERLLENHQDIGRMETPSRLLGIELPCFIARSFWSCSSPWSSELSGHLLSYLESKSLLLAQVVDLQLHTQHGLALMLSSHSSMDMDIFQRYLQRKRTAVAVPSQRITTLKKAPRPDAILTETALLRITVLCHE